MIIVVLGIKVSHLVQRLFIKAGLLADSVNVSYNKNVVKFVVKIVATENKSVIQQSVATGKSTKKFGQKQKDKIFVPIYHFCGVKGHIRPRCFTLMNFLENHAEKTNFSRYFQKPTPRPKIDLNDSRKMWVKRVR